MKHLNKLFVVGAVVGAVTTSQAQTEDQPWSLSVGANAIDGARSSLDFSLLNRVKGAHRVSNWSILPSVSYLNVSRNIVGGLSFGVTGSVNRVTKIYQIESTPGQKKGEVIWMDDAEGKKYKWKLVDINKMYYGLDGQLKYNFGELLGSSWFDPSLHLGGGYTWFGDDQSSINANFGAGFTFWFTKNIGILLQSTYKMQFNEDDSRSSREALTMVPSHLQHVAGITFRFGGSDKDNDGVLDKYDHCPELPGLIELNGCPDTDKDGVIDPNDDCPYEAGPVELNGCPDSDKDGIPDNQDACPNEAGLVEFNGCPDTDGDGIMDSEDECPNLPGPKSHNGCPIPDTDGDGLNDEEDKCPKQPGTKANKGCPDRDGDGIIDLEDDCPDKPGPASNNGCPEVKKETIKKLNDYGKTILFNSGKATFKDETYPVLDKMAEVMAEFPNAKFSIEGHTDNTGSDKINHPLSEQRAAAVKDYLISKGINANRLMSEGFGSSKPIDSNKTSQGRANNRRTEIRLIK